MFNASETFFSLCLVGAMMRLDLC